MLATLNSKQIVDEIVKDTLKDNDPHDALQISPEVVLASRAGSDAPTLAPEIASRAEPKIAEPKFAEPKLSEPKVNVATEPPPPAVAPSVDTAIRAAAGDLPSRQKRSSIGRWLGGAFATFLFAGAGVAATVAWEQHGDTAKQLIATWVPGLSSALAPSAAQTTAATADQAAQPVAPAPTDQASADQSAAPPAAQDSAAATSPGQPQALQTMTRDLAAMSQQIEQLKTTIAELKAGQEQIAREMAKTPAPRAAEARPVDPRARVSALPPRPPAAPVRKPKPVTAPAYATTYAPAPIAPPPPSQAVAVPPPPVAPVTSSQTIADDDGPVVRPPMPVH